MVKHTYAPEFFFIFQKIIKEEKKIYTPVMICKIKIHKFTKYDKKMIQFTLKT